MPLTDPVTKFAIPDSWLKSSKDPRVRDKVRSGRWVILSDGRLLRRGLTTGSTAAAACKGAVISLRQNVEDVEVPTPAGIRVRVSVTSERGSCTALKEGGDHESDVTAGVRISARANILASRDVELVAGPGIGRISRKGLCAPLGKAAISQGARRQIMEAIAEGLDAVSLEGARVEISVPLGEALARETLNPQVGVVGGISILGSTGFVEPWNEHLGESVAEEARRHPKVVVTTGRMGLRYSRILFPDHVAVLVGGKLDSLAFCQEQEGVLCGLPGLILRWAMPGILEGTAYATVAEMIESEPDHPRIDQALAAASKKLPGTKIVLIQRDGSIFRSTPSDQPKE